MLRNHTVGMPLIKTVSVSDKKKQISGTRKNNVFWIPDGGGMSELPVFVDGVRQINFIGGTVRMELFYSQPTEYDEQNREKAVALIMAPQGFLSMFDAMQQTADALVKQGVLQKETNTNNATEKGEE